MSTNVEDLYTLRGEMMKMFDSVIQIAERLAQKERELEEREKKLKQNEITLENRVVVLEKQMKNLLDKQKISYVSKDEKKDEENRVNEKSKPKIQKLSKEMTMEKLSEKNKISPEKMQQSEITKEKEKKEENPFVSLKQVADKIGEELYLKANLNLHERKYLVTFSKSEKMDGWVLGRQDVYRVDGFGVAINQKGETIELPRMQELREILKKITKRIY